MKRILPAFFLICFLFFQITGKAWSENLDVTLRVPVPAEYLINTLREHSTQTKPGDTVLYTIGYGTTLSFPNDITITASWGQGIPEDGSSPIDLLQYKPNSATNAYGGAQPVIDTVNKTITWNIINVPGKTTEYVEFILTPKPLATGTTRIDFTVTSTIHVTSSPFSSTSSATASYKEIYPSSPSTTTPTPTQSAPASSPSPTPTPASNSSFNNISAQEISSSSTTIGVTTNSPSEVAIDYGTSPKTLTKKVTDPNFATSHTLLITDLTANTIYYYRVRSISKNGTANTSDTYTFKTASFSLAPEVDLKTLVVVSRDNFILNNPSANAGGNFTSTVVSLPYSAPYSFTFSLLGHQSVKQLTGILKSVNSTSSINLPELTSSVDGNLLIRTAYAAGETENTQLAETQKGVYKGRLSENTPPGLYDLYMQITDFNGNIKLQKITRINITKPLTVYSDSTKSPIEGAKVFLSMYSNSLKKFVPVLPNTLTDNNPATTDVNGEVNFILPAGVYQVEARSIGFKTKTTRFTIKNNASDVYPQIYLTYAGSSMSNSVEFYAFALSDFYQESAAYLFKYAHSSRFFELNALLSIVLFTILLLFSLSERLKIPLLSLPFSIFHFIRLLTTHRKQRSIIKGKVYDDESKNLLQNAHIFLLDAAKGFVIASTKTNLKGEFAFYKNSLQNYAIQVIKEGYEPITFLESDLKDVDLKGYMLHIRKSLGKSGFIKTVTILFEKLFSVLFETLLVASFVFEAFISLALSPAKAAPFLAISLCTLLLWLIHLSRLHMVKKMS